MAEPHSPLEDKVAQAWSKCTIDLTELYRGGDPFKPTTKPEATEQVVPKGYDGAVEVPDDIFN